MISLTAALLNFFIFKFILKEEENDKQLCIHYMYYISQKSLESVWSAWLSMNYSIVERGGQGKGVELSIKVCL